MYFTIIFKKKKKERKETSLPESVHMSLESESSMTNAIKVRIALYSCTGLPFTRSFNSNI